MFSGTMSDDTLDVEIAKGVIPHRPRRFRRKTVSPIPKVETITDLQLFHLIEV